MDQEFIRELLLMIEAGQSVFETLPADSAAALSITPKVSMTRAEAKKLSDHLDLLIENGLVKKLFISGAGVYTLDGITLKGRDYLKRIR